MRFSYLLILAFTLIPAASGADPPQLDPATMQALVSEALKAWDVPGVAIAVVDRDRVLWLHGHGVQNIDTGQRLSHETIFPIASCSKAFTATLIAALVGEGRMAWDDGVRKHLPEFHLSDSLADSAVTIRDLLTHRTGLASHDYLWYRSHWSPAEQVRRAGLLPLERPFRTSFQYQSVMVTAAGLAAAHAGGDSWEALVQRRLFQPLQMTTARCTSPPATANRASPHKADSQGKLCVMSFYDQPTPNPAGSIHASARDLVGWLQFQLGDGSFRGKEIVAPAAFCELHTPQMALRLDGVQRAISPATNLMSYALGWIVQDYRGHRLVSHAGAIDGFRAHITLLPDRGCGFVLLCNRHQTRMNLALSNTLVDRLVGLPVRDWNAYYKDIVSKEVEATAAVKKKRRESQKPDEKPSLAPADYAGTYDHPAYGTARVAWDGKELNWEWSGFRGPLRHFQGDEYEVDDANLAENNVVFRIDNGRLIGLDFLNLRFAKK